MFRQSVLVLWFIFIFTAVHQGCSSDSGLSDTDKSAEVNSSGWSTQLVKYGNFANGEINASMGADGKLYVNAYEFNIGLQYITNKSGVWISTLVAEDNGNNAGTLNDITVDNNGKVHIVYSCSKGIKYVTNESGAWSEQNMWSGGGGSCSIVSDSQGNLHSAFDDGDRSDIRYTYKSWGDEWDTSVVLADEWINSCCDIDVDRFNNPHIIFNFSGHHNLRYASFESSWRVFTIEGSDSYPYIPDTGWTPSIAVNKNTDEANIVFWNSTDNSLQFSNGIENSAVTLKDNLGWVKPCIALDSNGYAHVFFGEPGTNNLNYATNKNGSWVNRVLSIETGADEFAVVIDTDDKIHLLYSNEMNQGLYHASFQL
jgi:hypothetical protein